MTKQNLSSLIRSYVSIAGGPDVLMRKLMQIPQHYFKPEVNVLKSDWERVIGDEKPLFPVEITVNYGLGFTKLIDLAGIASWNTNTFPKKIRLVSSSEGKKRFLFDVVELREDMNFNQIVDLIKTDGWMFAGIEHLLTFSARFPEEHLKGEIDAFNCFYRRLKSRDESQVPITLRNFGKTKRRKSIYIDNIIRWHSIEKLCWDKGSRVLKVKPL